MVTHRFLSILTPAQIASLTALGVVRTFPGGTLLWQKGEEGKYLYVLMEGLVKIIAETQEGKEVVLAIIRPGETLGEMSVLDGSPRSATALTMKKSRVLAVPAREVLSFLAQEPQSFRSIIQTLSDRLRRATEEIVALKEKNLEWRVARKLLWLCAEEEGTDLSVTHEILASMVGSTRENVTRSLHLLKKKGLINLSRGKISVLNRESLQQLVGEWR